MGASLLNWASLVNPSAPPGPICPLCLAELSLVSTRLSEGSGRHSTRVSVSCVAICPTARHKILTFARHRNKHISSLNTVTLEAETCTMRYTLSSFQCPALIRQPSWQRLGTCILMRAVGLPGVSSSVYRASVSADVQNSDAISAVPRAALPTKALVDLSCISDLKHHLSCWRRCLSRAASGCESRSGAQSPA